MADNKVRKINLDDMDDMDAVLDDTSEFDQDVDFESITGVVEPGEYRLKNEQITLKKSKSTNRPMFTVRASIMSGPHEGVGIFQDYSWADGLAQVRSKRAFVGMGLPVGYKGSMRDMAEGPGGLKDLEYFAVITVQQSDGINERTQQPYDPRNQIVSTSETPQTTG